MAYRRGPEQSSARTERWQREDEAERLSSEIAHLEALKIVIEECRGEQHVSGGRYTKHVIVSRAPARFELPCGEPKCQDGGHDVTYELMRALRDRVERLEGHSDCRGSIGDRLCDRSVKFAAFATYKPRSK